MWSLPSRARRLVRETHQASKQTRDLVAKCCVSGVLCRDWQGWGGRVNRESQTKVQRYISFRVEAIGQQVGVGNSVLLLEGSWIDGRGQRGTPFVTPGSSRPRSPTQQCWGLRFCTDYENLVGLPHKSSERPETSQVKEEKCGPYVWKGGKDTNHRSHVTDFQQSTYLTEMFL